MMKTISIEIGVDVHDELKKIGSGLFPASEVVSRLLKHWQETAERRSMLPVITRAERAPFWESSRGERFPIGLELSADYLGESYKAVVSEKGILFDGKTYDNPSKAAMAVKLAAGTSKKSAATNGWTFWMMQSDDRPGWLTSINKLRKQKS
jgi:predicted CopG family antitoxin